jgi:hypothetical protein
MNGTGPKAITPITAKATPGGEAAGDSSPVPPETAAEALVAWQAKLKSAQEKKKREAAQYPFLSKAPTPIKPIQMGNYFVPPPSARPAAVADVPAAAPVVPGAAEAPEPGDPRPKPTDVVVRRWMRERVANWPGDKPAPNEDGDFAAATAHFAPGLSRDEFRLVRNAETPAEWRKQGRRKPWGKAKQSAANPPIRGPQK